MIQIHTMPLGSYQTNCYLIYEEGSQSCVVIDPGYESQQILLEAKRLGKTIEAILLTHGHFDHVGAVRQIAADTDCSVYVCADELTIPARLSAGPIYHTHTYGEGDVLNLAGLSLKVMHTPGHSVGSVCLVCQNHIFSGDTLFAGTCGRTDLPGGSWTQIVASLKRLSAIRGDYQVHPGHGESTTLEEERQFNPYMQ